LCSREGTLGTVNIAGVKIDDLLERFVGKIKIIVRMVERKIITKK